MWLSETAVDTETLRILAQNGILYTVLAPHQVRRVRPIGFNSRWEMTPNETVNTKHPYRILLEGGRQFHGFFYDAPVSREIAFQGLLSSGDHLCHRLLHALAPRRPAPPGLTGTRGGAIRAH